MSNAGAPDAAGNATALSGGRAAQVAAAPPEARGGLTERFAGAYADGLRDVFLACGAAGILGGLLVFWLVRSQAPGAGERPAAAPSARESAPESAPESEPAVR